MPIAKKAAAKKTPAKKAAAKKAPAKKVAAKKAPVAGPRRMMGIGGFGKALASHGR